MLPLFLFCCWPPRGFSFLRLAALMFVLWWWWLLLWLLPLLSVLHVAQVTCCFGHCLLLVLIICRMYVSIARFCWRLFVLPHQRWWKKRCTTWFELSISGRLGMTKRSLRMLPFFLCACNFFCFYLSARPLPFLGWFCMLQKPSSALLYNALFHLFLLCKIYKRVLRLWDAVARNACPCSVKLSRQNARVKCSHKPIF